MDLYSTRAGKSRTLDKHRTIGPKIRLVRGMWRRGSSRAIRRQTCIRVVSFGKHEDTKVRSPTAPVTAHVEVRIRTLPIRGSYGCVQLPTN